MHTLTYTQHTFLHSQWLCRGTELAGRSPCLLVSRRLEPDTREDTDLVSSQPKYGKKLRPLLYYLDRSQVANCFPCVERRARCTADRTCESHHRARWQTQAHPLFWGKRFCFGNQDCCCSGVNDITVHNGGVWWVGYSALYRHLKPVMLTHSSGCTDERRRKRLERRKKTEAKKKNPYQRHLYSEQSSSQT